MHIKYRKQRALLYRSRWIAKGSCGNTHGYSKQEFVASLPKDALDIPAEIIPMLTAEESALVQARIVVPAQKEAERESMRAQLRALDPVWRLQEATRLINEAAQLSQKALVTSERISAVERALADVRLQSPAPKKAESMAVASSAKLDPLREALRAIESATQAVQGGMYGNAPTEGVRNTSVYLRWAEIFEAVTGSEEGSLLRALQARGYAKTRGKTHSQ
jgi:hypothetical protein